MKARIVIPIFAVMIGVSLMLAAFVVNASPYVTIAAARNSSGGEVHVAGTIVPGSIITNSRQGEVRFELKDDEGDTMHVLYTGSPLSNMSKATRVVAVGKMSDGRFVSEKLLLKCPSKYEAVNADEK